MNKKAEHPLNGTEVNFNNTNALQGEERRINRYTYMHNFAKELYNDYAEVQERYEAHDCDIKIVIARFKAIKTRMRHLEDNAKYTLANLVPDATRAERIIEEANEFKSLLNDFHKDVERLSRDSDSMHDVFTPLDDKDKQLSEIFREYKQFKNELYNKASDKNGIGYAYDADEQEFLGSMATVNDKQSEFIGVCNLVIDRYNLLIEEVEKTYAQWDKCNVMIEMMRFTIVAPYDISLVCLN